LKGSTWKQFVKWKDVIQIVTGVTPGIVTIQMKGCIIWNESSDFLRT